MAAPSRKLLLFAGLALLAGLAIWAGWPRRVNLREFDPAAVARLETAMWRDYYEKHYVALFGGLYALNRDEYGFSPWDSLRIAWYAAKAAKQFQPTTSRAEAQIALPTLERYYGVIRARSGEQFDIREAARLELDWWQLRREKATPAEYGAVVAQTTTAVFHVANAAIAEAGQVRAAMMAYRDERREGRMRDEDWAHIERHLTRAYELLRAGLAPPPSAP